MPSKIFHIVPDLGNSEVFICPLFTTCKPDNTEGFGYFL